MWLASLGPAVTTLVGTQQTLRDSGNLRGTAVLKGPVLECLAGPGPGPWPDHSLGGSMAPTLLLVGPCGHPAPHAPPDNALDMGALVKLSPGCQGTR